MRSCVTSIVDAIEAALCDPFNAIHDTIAGFSTEADGYVKESDQGRKRLYSEAASCKKDMTSMVTQLKKARDHYHKAAKEAQQVVNGGKNQSKADALSKKALDFDQKYREALELTNAKQDIHYSSEQPTILRQFQRWEEARIDFMNKANEAFKSAVAAAGLDRGWAQLSESVAASIDSVDAAGDIRTYANAARADIGTVCNTPYEYEPSPEGGPTVGPPPVAASPRTRAATTRSNSFSDNNNNNNNSNSSGVSARRAVPPVPPKSYHGSSEAAEEQGGTGEETYGQGDDYYDNEGGEGEGEKYKVLFDYTPANDGEMEIHAGDIVLVMEKDESGWWFATCKGNEGFIPSEFVEPA